MNTTRKIHASCKSGIGKSKHQAGVTLIEAMISLALSLIVTASMVALMGNSMGSATRIIQMSKLTDELRNSMSMMSRDIRRANYSANSIYCYANSNCGADGSATQYADINVTDGSCFIFGLDRDWDGDASNDDAGAFRRVTSGSIGVIEMWVGGSSPACATTGNDWVAITDPDIVDITVFTISNAGSFEQSLATLTKRTRQIQMQVGGRLIMDNTIDRTIEDTIKVRNDFFL
jgi:Tfp pilus assembly protein PilV